MAAAQGPCLPWPAAGRSPAPLLAARRPRCATASGRCLLACGGTKRGSLKPSLAAACLPPCVRTRFAGISNGKASRRAMTKFLGPTAHRVSYGAFPSSCGGATVERASTCTPYDVAYAPAAIDTSKEVRLDRLARLVRYGGRVVLNVSLAKGTLSTLRG